MKRRNLYIISGIVILSLIAVGVLLALSKTTVPFGETCFEYNGETICLPAMSFYSISPPALTLAAGDNIPTYEPGDTVTQTLSVSGVATVDENYLDGDVTYVYVKWAIYKEGSEIESGEWTKLSSPAYSKTFTKSYTNLGKYAYVLVLTKAESTYGSGGWSDYTITELDKESYTFYVGAPQPSKPIEKLIAFFQGIIEWIMGLFG